MEMNNACEFRLIELILEGVKNVEKGKLSYKGTQNTLKDSLGEFPTGEVLGIYGPNGSGKTAAILSMLLLQCIMRDLSHTNNFSLYSLACEWCDVSSITYKMYIADGNDLEATCNYIVFFRKPESKEQPFLVVGETLQISIIKASGKYAGFPSCKIHIDYESGKASISNDEYFKGIINAGNTTESKLLSMAKFLAMKHEGVTDCRFIMFSDRFFDYLSDKGEHAVQLKVVLSCIRQMIRTHLFVHTTEHDAVTSFGLGTLHAVAKDNEHSERLSGLFPLGSFGPFDIPVGKRPVYDNLIEQINVLVSSCIPNFKAKIVSHGMHVVQGETSDPDNPPKNETIEVVREVEKGVIPLSCESAGVRKLVNLAGALIEVYNNPSSILVVDEIDSGVFEYLLGQILLAMKDGMKGQLMFSCHNLRPLEVLHGEDMYFTTLNMQRRYIMMTGIKQNNNARTSYFRAMQLGGQKEDLYEETNISEIQRALRRGGKLIHDEH